MIFNKHLSLVGHHAFLSASKYHWVNYDEDKLDRVYLNAEAAAKGDRLHKLAHDLIREGVKLKGTKQTLNMYVNDCIGFRMTPEQILFYSVNCFGCADAISFRRNVLRISDLKTGVTPTSEKQLLIYAALFCLEYDYRPHALAAIELRIYQNDEIREYLADPDEVAHIMETIKRFDARIEFIKEGALS